MEEPMSSITGVTSRMIWQTAIWGVVTAALLFIPAGTLRWPEAWIYLLLLNGVGLMFGIVMARRDPDLVKERMRSPIQRDQKSWDKALISVFLVLWLALYVVSALDAVRFRTSDMPVWLEVVGALGIVAGFWIFYLVMRENTFAVPVVKIQTERKHQVISTGPYAYVRHPMYGGVIPLILGSPLLLGSWYGVAIGVALIALLAYRAVLEETMLKQELEGYDAYAARVPYRLVPGLW